MTNSGLIDSLKKMLQQGRDSALLRYGLGVEYLKQGDLREATLHLQEAVHLDPGYSAAWKMLGRALTEDGLPEEGAIAYRSGITAAETKGDLQAAKEMRVFLKRLERTTDD